MQAAAGPKQRCYSRAAQRSRVNTVQCRAVITVDNSTRVRGNVRVVFDYVSDYRRLDQWWPGISNIQTTRGDGKPLAVRHQFQMEQSIAGFKVTTLYEVVDMQKDKKIVYSVGSDLHSATEQLIFMPDPNDPAYTVVRHMAQVQLSEWRGAFMPVVSGLLKSLPEQGIKQLGLLLNSSDSPILQYQVASSNKQQAGPTKSGWNFSHFLNGLRNDPGTVKIKKQPSPEPPQPSIPVSPSSSSSSSSNSNRSSKGSNQMQVDALGYYAALGLGNKSPQEVSPDEVKSAFRKAAQALHPDKFSSADDEDRMAAETRFKKVQQAYEVLRDPQQRWLYDQGRVKDLKALQLEALDIRDREMEPTGMA